MLSHRFRTLDRNEVIDALLLLLPEQGNAASNLNKTVHVLLEGDNELTFHEVCDVRVVIDSTRDKASSSHCESAPGNEHNLHG